MEENQTSQTQTSDVTPQNNSITWVINDEENTVEITASDSIFDFSYQNNAHQFTIAAFEKESDVKKMTDITLDVAAIKALREQLNNLDLPA